MNTKDFFSYYIPALVQALQHDNVNSGFYIKTPEHFINESERIKSEIDIYLDKNAGKDEFLDRVGYYFDAKSHGFEEIVGISLNDYKKIIEDEILIIKNKYEID